MMSTRERRANKIRTNEHGAFFLISLTKMGIQSACMDDRGRIIYRISLGNRNKPLCPYRLGKVRLLAPTKRFLCCCRSFSGCRQEEKKRRLWDRLHGLFATFMHTSSLVLLISAIPLHCRLKRHKNDAFPTGCI